MPGLDEQICFLDIVSLIMLLFTLESRPGDLVAGASPAQLTGSIGAAGFTGCGKIKGSSSSWQSNGLQNRRLRVQILPPLFCAKGRGAVLARFLYQGGEGFR